MATRRFHFLHFRPPDGSSRWAGQFRQVESKGFALGLQKFGCDLMNYGNILRSLDSNRLQALKHFLGSGRLPLFKPDRYQDLKRAEQRWMVRGIALLQN